MLEEHPEPSKASCVRPRLRDLQFVFLDRDGVINRKLPEGQFVTTVNQFEILPRVVESVGRLNRKGIKVILVTNQRAIALGLLTEAGLEAIHNHLQVLLAAVGAHLDAIYFCPHDPIDNCECRKPSVGMFKQAAEDFPQISAKSCIIVGDSLSDVRAGISLGIHTIFVEGDAGTRKSGHDEAAALADSTARSLAEAVDTILQEQ